jgi:uncharacterized protein YkwD
MAAFGLLVFALVLPTQANQVAQTVLGGAVSINSATGVSTSPVSAISSIVSNAITTTISNVKDDITTPKASTPTTKDNSPLSIENIIDATNVERVKANLPPLKTDEKLAASSKLKVEDMVANHYFEHTSPSGKTVADLGNQVGYDYVVMGENLALGDFANATDLLQAWMNSPGHRANILNTSYEEIGVYAAQGTYQGRTVWFAVQHFGTERGVCPALNTSLKTSISALNVEVKKQEAQITALRAQIEDANHIQGAGYSALIAQFNTLVASYNSNVTLAQQKISTYNKQVVTFNNCLSKYQTSKEE